MSNRFFETGLNGGGEKAAPLLTFAGGVRQSHLVDAARL
jgi:hypothetical protein